MPLSRRSFLLSFVSLCVAFVPVVLLGPFFAFMEPVSAIILDIFYFGFERVSILVGIHALIYIGAFTAIGAFAYFLIRFLRWRTAQWLSLAVLLSLPVLCSFARVLTSASMDGRGGTYTFWEAVHRYFEKNR